MLHVFRELLCSYIAWRFIPEDTIPISRINSFDHFGQNHVIFMSHDCRPLNVAFYF